MLCETTTPTAEPLSVPPTDVSLRCGRRKHYVKQRSAGAHGGLEVDDGAVSDTVARPGCALPGPEESLVDLLLGDVAELHLFHHGINKIDFRF